MYLSARSGGSFLFHERNVTRDCTALRWSYREDTPSNSTCSVATQLKSVSRILSLFLTASSSPAEVAAVHVQCLWKSVVNHVFHHVLKGEY